MFSCEIWLFLGIFLNSANLICRSTDISKCFRGSLRLRDNENRLCLIDALIQSDDSENGWMAQILVQPFCRAHTKINL